MVLWARHVYRRYGRIWVVVELPDGGVTSVPVDSTDIAGAPPKPAAPVGTTTLSVAGVRRLRALLAAQAGRAGEGAGAGDGR
jgi:hypothetical protein